MDAGDLPRFWRLRVEVRDRASPLHVCGYHKNWHNTGSCKDSETVTLKRVTAMVRKRVMITTLKRVIVLIH